MVAQTISENHFLKEFLMAEYVQSNGFSRERRLPAKKFQIII